MCGRVFKHELCWYARILQGNLLFGRFVLPCSDVSGQLIYTNINYLRVLRLKYLKYIHKEKDLIVPASKTALEQYIFHWVNVFQLSHKFKKFNIFVLYNLWEFNWEFMKILGILNIIFQHFVGLFVQIPTELNLFCTSSNTLVVLYFGIFLNFKHHSAQSNCAKN